MAGRSPLQRVLKRICLFVMIAIPGDVCFLFLLRQKPGPDGYVGIQILFLTVVVTYINASGTFLSHILMPEPPTRDRKLNQVST